MPDTLIAYTPLGSRAELRLHGVAAAVLLTEIAPSAMIDLRANTTDSTTLQAVQQVLGVALPLASNKTAASDGKTVWWLGPDQWLIVAPPGEAASLTQSLNGATRSVVDVSDLRAEFELAGPCATDVLRKGCGIDLHPRVFAPGDCALTSLARVRVALRQIDGRPAYTVLVERSVAPYLWDWLVDAMREFVGG